MKKFSKILMLLSVLILTLGLFACNPEDDTPKYDASELITINIKQGNVEKVIYILPESKTYFSVSELLSVMKNAKSSGGASAYGLNYAVAFNGEGNVLYILEINAAGLPGNYPDYSQYGVSRAIEEIPDYIENPEFTGGYIDEAGTQKYQVLVNGKDRSIGYYLDEVYLKAGDILHIIWPGEVVPAK